MEYFTVQGRNQWEAMDKIRAQYGSSARILTRKTIRFGGFFGVFQREGIEISGYLAREPLLRAGQGRSGSAAGLAAAEPVLRAAQNGAASAAGAPAGGAGRLAPAESFEEEKQKILDGVHREKTLKLILEEIRALKKSTPAPAGEPLHPTLARVKEILELNEFTKSYIQKMLERVKAEFSLEKLEDFDAVQQSVVEWIGQGIEIHSPNGKSKRRPRVLVVVGPTGVGKTTTIAKLAAVFALGSGEEPGVQVRMVTIDNYRIAAKQQIETYAEIMQIPISFAESRADLAKTIDLYQDVDVILIDTIGKSPADFSKLGEMKSILNACGSLGEIHLAVSATTKTSDVLEVLRHFEPFHYDSIILTKLDETNRVGNIISILTEKKKRLSFITDGQQVPQDIETASVTRLLRSLEGFRVDTEALESKFGTPVVDKWNGWSVT